MRLRQQSHANMYAYDSTRGNVGVVGAAPQVLVTTHSTSTSRCLDGGSKRSHDTANGQVSCRQLAPLEPVQCTRGPHASPSPAVNGGPLLPPVNLQAAPDLYCDGWATQEAAHQTRAVHFVRQPADMAVSAFQYHSQTPCPEDWQDIKPPHNDSAVCDPSR